MLETPVKNKDDDQLYYSKVFLDTNIRNKLKIKLDYESEIFLNLNGASADVRVLYNDATGEYFVKNIVTDTAPSFIHGNGPSKVLLNNFGSYVAGAFKHNECQLCVEIDFKRTSELISSVLQLNSKILNLQFIMRFYFPEPRRFIQTKSNNRHHYSECHTIHGRILRFDFGFRLSKREIKPFHLQ